MSAGAHVEDTQQHSARLGEKIVASGHGYIGFTRKRLFQAAEEVLGDLGPSNFALDNLAPPPAQNGRLIPRDCLLVDQPHNRLYVWSRLYWNVCLSDDGDGRTLMQVSATTQQVDGLLPQYMPLYKRDIPVLLNGGLTVAEAQLFFERIDLNLHPGVKPWLTCKVVRISHTPKNMLHYICRNGDIASPTTPLQ